MEISQELSNNVIKKRMTLQLYQSKKTRLELSLNQNPTADLLSGHLKPVKELLVLSYINSL